MKRMLTTLAVLLAAGTLWGHEGHKPAETDFQGDRCAECRMAVTDRSYAAQIVGSGISLFFDDAGCLVQYERQGKISGEAVHGRFVRAAAGGSWLAVEKAVWVLFRGVRTPMGYGLHAFADTQGAEAFVQDKTGARLLSWKEALEAVPAKKRMM